METFPESGKKLLVNQSITVFNGDYSIVYTFLKDENIVKLLAIQINKSIAIEEFEQLEAE